jgi:hypothetical protein
MGTIVKEKVTLMNSQAIREFCWMISIDETNSKYDTKYAKRPD